MIGQNMLLFLTTASCAVAYTTLAKASFADPINDVVTQSRQLADAGKWEEAGTVLENRLARRKLLVVPAMQRKLKILSRNTPNEIFHQWQSLNYRSARFISTFIPANRFKVSDPISTQKNSQRPWSKPG